MLNPFPDLLAFSFFAPLLLRLALGFILLDFGKRTLGSEKAQSEELFRALGFARGKQYATALGSLQIATALMLIAGFYTQIAALVAFIFSLSTYYLKGKHGAHIEHRRHLFFLTAIVALSLLLSGAGAIAFDLPL